MKVLLKLLCYNKSIDFQVCIYKIFCLKTYVILEEEYHRTVFH